MERLSILVVDDEQGIRDVMEELFVSEGHRVACAVNGVEAVARAAGGGVDIVFMDIRMPKGDGLTALKEIKSLWPSMPVIIMTGYHSNEMTAKAQALGADACLLKPFNLNDALAMLDLCRS